MGRVDVWYFCTRCKARNKSGPGRLFCPDCGGELRSIGYKVHGGKPFVHPYVKGDQT